MPTISPEVSASADDAEELDDGSMVLDESNLYPDGNNNWTGYRFQNVTVASGSTIDSAFLKLATSNGTSPGSVSFDYDIWGNDVDDAAAFTTDSNNISGRTRTTATVAWADTTTVTNTDDYLTSPDIKGIIQEIVDRVGWASGNDIVLVMHYAGLSGLEHHAFEAGNGLYAILEITYTEGGGGGITEGEIMAAVQAFAYSTPADPVGIPC